MPRLSQGTNKKINNNDAIKLPKNGHCGMMHRMTTALKTTTIQSVDVHHRLAGKAGNTLYRWL